MIYTIILLVSLFVLLQIEYTKQFILGGDWVTYIQTDKNGIQQSFTKRGILYIPTNSSEYSYEFDSRIFEGANILSHLIGLSVLFPLNAWIAFFVLIVAFVLHWNQGYVHRVLQGGYYSRVKKYPDRQWRRISRHAYQLEKVEQDMYECRHYPINWWWVIYPVIILLVYYIQ